MNICLQVEKKYFLSLSLCEGHCSLDTTAANVLQLQDPLEGFYS